MTVEIIESQVLRISGNEAEPAADAVVVEEPLEICVATEPAVVVMRTPGHDFDLACGFALGEGLIDDAAEIGTVGYGDPAEFNRVEIHPVPGHEFRRPAGDRLMPASAACGVCGTKSIDSIRANVADLNAAPGSIELGRLLSLPGRMRFFQDVFDSTGGLHAAGLFDLDGQLVAVREDVGRHCAVDKIVGHLARQGRGTHPGDILCVSGRAGFEIVQKAAAARIAIVVAVSAPSSLAIDLAEATGITLAAFVRDGGGNIYTHGHRVVRS